MFKILTMKTLFLSFVMISASLLGQTHRFIYEYTFKTDSTAADNRKVNMVLDVNPEDVKFYNYDFVQTDSLNITNGQNNVVWDDTPAVIRKRNSFSNSSYIHVQNMFIVDTEDRIDWKLSEDTRTFGGYNLQKATAQFGGRHWTAWFTKDIALSEGPYKFRGLPGLIFEIYDDKDNFKFTLLKSYKLPKTYDTSGIIENFAGQKPVKISGERLKKLMLENYNDPLHEFKEHYKNNTDPSARFMVMGIEVKRPEQLKELSDRVQANIRKTNNPLEIDKAVHYPEK